MSVHRYITSVATLLLWQLGPGMDLPPLHPLGAHFHTFHPEALARIHAAIATGDSLSQDIESGPDDEDVSTLSEPLVTPATSLEQMRAAAAAAIPSPSPDFVLDLAAVSSPPLVVDSHSSSLPSASAEPPEPSSGASDQASASPVSSPSLGPIEMFDPTANDNELWGLLPADAPALDRQTQPAQTLRSVAARPRTEAAQVRVATDTTIEVTIPDFDITIQHEVRQLLRMLPLGLARVLYGKVVIEADDPVARNQALDVLIQRLRQERDVKIYEIISDYADVLGLERRMSSPLSLSLGPQAPLSRDFAMPRRKR